MESKKWIWVGAGVIVIIIIATVFITRSFMGSSEENYAQPTPYQAPTSSATRGEVPSDAVVLDVGAKNVPPNVGVPSIQAPSAPNNAAAQFRSFPIKIENGEFVPNTFVLNSGDTMDLEITAVDGDYDFTQPDYGFSATIKKGNTQRIQGSASIQGKFTFYCKSCGGPAKGPVGYFIIK